MQSQASTVDEYLSELPADRRAALQAVREVFLRNLDQDYEEGMQYGMIGYYVPHRVYPAGYHCDPRLPLCFAGLSSQKHYMSLYLMSVYGEGDHWNWFQQAWAKTGKKLDMGKCCVRFKKVDDLALDVIAEVLRRTPARKYIEHYESVIQGSRRKAAKKRAAKSSGSLTVKRATKATKAVNAPPRGTASGTKRAARKRRV